MKQLLNAGRVAWFGNGMIVGLALAEVLPWGLSFVFDLIQALDFTLT